MTFLTDFQKWCQKCVEHIWLVSPQCQHCVVIVRIHMCILQCVAVCCSVLQRVARNSMLQRVAVCCSVLRTSSLYPLNVINMSWQDLLMCLCYSVSQCVATCCSVLQCVAHMWPSLSQPHDGTGKSFIFVTALLSFNIRAISKQKSRDIHTYIHTHVHMYTQVHVLEGQKTCSPTVGKLSFVTNSHLWHTLIRDTLSFVTLSFVTHSYSWHTIICDTLLFVTDSHSWHTLIRDKLSSVTYS